jgi:hypothetical protein
MSHVCFTLYLPEICGRSELHVTFSVNGAWHLVYITICYKVGKNLLFPHCGRARCESLAD